MLAWEQQQADELLADVFGYHAVQLGWPALQALRSNRMPHRWLAQAEFEACWPRPTLDQEPGHEQAHEPTYEPSHEPGHEPTQEGGPDVHLDSRAWPWPADSLDLVVLPHALERSADPHACLREVERVLIPEGQVLITGMNPWSWWGWQQSRGQRARGLMGHVHPSLIGYRRLRDWLRLLGFEVQVSRFGGWPLAQGGERWWPILGGVYLVMATKRVPGGRLVQGRRWRAVRSPAATTVPVARSDTSIGHQSAAKDIVDPR